MSTTLGKLPSPSVTRTPNASLLTLAYAIPLEYLFQISNYNLFSIHNIWDSSKGYMRIEQKIKREELSLSNLLTRRNLGGVKEGTENAIETIAILYNTRCQWMCHTKLIYI